MNQRNIEIKDPNNRNPKLKYYHELVIKFCKRKRVFSKTQILTEIMNQLSATETSLLVFQIVNTYDFIL